MKIRLSLPLIALVPLVLASCGTMEKIADVATDPFGPRIPVVEAREGDLRQVRSGEEKAIAFTKSRRPSGFAALFRGPVDFNEPELPDDTGDLDGGLLPPKAN